MRQCKKIFLVTSSPNGAENLSLQYLAGPLQRAGFQPEIRLFQTIDDAIQLARQLAAAKCLFIGISIPSGDSALQLLPFIHLLRKRGVRRHICVGGVFATLAQDRLLQKHPIDSVISHDGELAVVQLAQALRDGQSIEDIPGVAIEAGQKTVTHPRCMELVNTLPLREKPKRYMGVRSAKISGSRGCHGQCTYCGLAAVRNKASAQDGRDAESLRTTWRRTPASIAAEMADLYHRRKVRFFHFVDENLLPPDAVDAAAFLHRLCDELDMKKVVHRAVSLMMRADVVTDDVATALERLGLVRSLLGVESCSDAGLKALNRQYAKDINKQAIQRMETIGAVFHYNVLMIHPDSTPRTIADEIAAIDYSTTGLIDPLMVRLYEGTTLFAQMEKEHRLQGGPYVWHYWPEASAARRFAQLFYLLRNHLGTFSVLTRFVYDTLGALGVHRRLGYLSSRSSTLSRMAAGIARDHNLLWQTALQSMWTLSQQPDGLRTSAELLERINRQAEPLLLRTWKLRNALEAASRHDLKSDIFYISRAVAAAAVISIMAGTGCHNVAPLDDDTESDTVVVEDSDTGDSATGDSETGTTDEPICDRDKAWDQSESLMHGKIDWDCGGDCREMGVNICSFVLNDEGQIINVAIGPWEYWDTEAMAQPHDEYIECVIAALEGQTFPCIAEHQPISHNIPIMLE